MANQFYISFNLWSFKINHWVIRIITFIQAVELIKYESYNTYDAVCDVLAFNFIKQALDEKFMCKVAKATTSKEAWKILEEEFGTKLSDMQ